MDESFELHAPLECNCEIRNGCFLMAGRIKGIYIRIIVFPVQTTTRRVIIQVFKGEQVVLPRLERNSKILF